MDFKNYRESNNFTDRSGAPWYDPNKLLSQVIIGMTRAIGSAKQKQLDAVQKSRDENPLTPLDYAKNAATTVHRTKDGNWITSTPGQVGEIISSPSAAIDSTIDSGKRGYVDPNVAAIYDLLHKHLQKK